MAFLSGIADWLKVGSSARVPAWMDAKEKKEWLKGKKYAIGQSI